MLARRIGEASVFSGSRFLRAPRSADSLVGAAKLKAYSPALEAALLQATELRFAAGCLAPPERGCVRRTRRSTCGCAMSPNDPKTRGLSVPLRLVLAHSRGPFPRALLTSHGRCHSLEACASPGSNRCRRNNANAPRQCHALSRATRFSRGARQEWLVAPCEMLPARVRSRAFRMLAPQRRGAGGCRRCRAADPTR